MQRPTEGERTSAASFRTDSGIGFQLRFGDIVLPATLTAMGPARANLATPGPYMLFLVNEAGVPSVAQTVMLSN